ncbi:MAG: hypothetical protein NVS2B16_16130 [Chloroflexota bacterium]
MAKQSKVKGLDAGDSIREAAVKILWVRFNDMWALWAPVSKGTDVEALHDMRVASRRLRTVMQTFRPCFPKSSFRRHYTCIQQIADLLGEVRDRDVLIEELNNDEERLVPEQRLEVRQLITELSDEREASRALLQKQLRDLHDEAYDRTFLGYLARQE